MDPVSLISGIAGIVAGVGKITKTLFDVTKSYQDAPQAYKHIINECFLINGALSQLQQYLTMSSERFQQNMSAVQLDLLVNTMAATRETFLELDVLVEDLAKSKSTKMRGLKYLWKESEIEETMKRLQHHKGGLTLILNIIKSESENETRKTLQEIMKFMKAMSDDQKKSWHSVRPSDLVSVDGQSLFSKADSESDSDTSTIGASRSLLNENTENGSDLSDTENMQNFEPDKSTFAFDAEILLSAVYNKSQYQDGDETRSRAQTFERRTILTVSDVTSIFDIPISRPPFGESPSNTSSETETRDEVRLEQQFEETASTNLLAVKRNKIPRPGWFLIFKLLPPKGKQRDDWADFWQLQPSDVEGVTRDELERQNSFHNLILTEFEFYEHVTSLPTFKEREWGCQNLILPWIALLQEMAKSLESNILEPLIDILVVQGPWIFSLCDQYDAWIDIWQVPLLEYARKFPWFHFRITSYAKRDANFSELLRRFELPTRLPWDFYLEYPVTRIKRLVYIFFVTIRKYTTLAENDLPKLEKLMGKLEGIAAKVDLVLDQEKKKVQEISIFEANTSPFGLNKWDEILGFQPSVIGVMTGWNDFKAHPGVPEKKFNDPAWRKRQTQKLLIELSIHILSINREGLDSRVVIICGEKVPGTKSILFGPTSADNFLQDNAYLKVGLDKSNISLEGRQVTPLVAYAASVRIDPHEKFFCVWMETSDLAVLLKILSPDNNLELVSGWSRV
ncbi:hypothetical protein TWF694_001774 [Orbilia ellipsospora]|uniref:Fungal N-terminal domain-containing protein n=1 Tax=Orbilia ellipsospora TaxID=2528407 RepID=A0AAV9X3V3_9PEZI